MPCIMNEIRGILIYKQHIIMKFQNLRTKTRIPNVSREEGKIKSGFGMA